MLKRRNRPPGQNNNSQPAQTRNHTLRNRILIGVAVVVVGGIAWSRLSGNRGAFDKGALFTAKRGNLRVSVEETGKIEAIKSVTVRSQVEGQTTIISIVPEGTQVKEGEPLVELDSATHREEIDKHKMMVTSAEASLTDAEEALDIQRNQNESDIKAAELTRDFALIDLKRCAGEVAYRKVLAAYEKEKKDEGEQTQVPELAPYFEALDAEKDYTDGDWHQQLLKAQNDITTAETSLKLAQSKVEGTEKLREKGYVTQTDLDVDRSSYQGAKISVDQVTEQKKLLINYDYPKQLAKFIADYEESEKKLQRAIRKADSALAQRDADLGAKKATCLVEKSRLERHQDQLSKTTIRAPQSGLVIYASSRGDPRRGNQGLIAEGEKVYERQQLIELPDLSKLKVEVKIHESVRDAVKQGQPAIFTLDALPGITLRGHVETIAIVPDSADRWMNPDLSVYKTTVIIDDKPDALKPGMTAKVEIILADLENVLVVPVHAVTVRGNKKVCFVVDGKKSVITPVEVGLSNEDYVEIKSGLKKGDTLLADAPMAPGRGLPWEEGRDAGVKRASRDVVRGDATKREAEEKK
jgi:HlyD family secretion protein